jgi:hypothetical protein
MYDMAFVARRATISIARGKARSHPGDGEMYGGKPARRSCGEKGEDGVPRGMQSSSEQRQWAGKTDNRTKTFRYIDKNITNKYENKIL